ncbi:hypothetical protein [Umezawaea sp.]|uniref:hypothetical protein n=1 Tax=Umezawaea sp. TaxID=1955258 RepID=UPI002ED0CCD4
MAGAVAFVFGLCALSFAAGCVVTAVMLRHTDPAEEAEQNAALPNPEPAPPPAEPLALPAPPELAAKPIHRNPVVSRPIPISLEHGDAAPAALALAPDPVFTGVFDPPPARLPVLVAEVHDESLTGELPAYQDPEPERNTRSATEHVAHTWSPAPPLPISGRTPRGRPDWRALHAEQAILLKAACGANPWSTPEQPTTLHVVQNAARPAEQQAEERGATAQPPAVAEPQPDPVPAESAQADHGQRREITLELLPQPKTEQDLVFASCSGLVTEPSDPEPAVPEQATHQEPEQEPVVPEQQAPGVDAEFRRRYLRTFEAARRKSTR